MALPATNSVVFDLVREVGGAPRENPGKAVNPTEAVGSPAGCFDERPSDVDCIVANATFTVWLLLECGALKARRYRCPPTH